MVELSPTSIDLMQQVINNPEEWDRYLIFADCLEEEGNDELAYTIRWMHENHRCPQPIVTAPSNVLYKYKYEWIHSRYTREEYPLAHLPIDIWKYMLELRMHWKGYYNWLDAVMDLSSTLHGLLTHTKTIQDLIGLLTGIQNPRNKPIPNGSVSYIERGKDTTTC